MTSLTVSVIVWNTLTTHFAHSSSKSGDNSTILSSTYLDYTSQLYGSTRDWTSKAMYSQNERSKISSIEKLWVGGMTLDCSRSVGWEIEAILPKCWSILSIRSIVRVPATKIWFKVRCFRKRWRKFCLRNHTKLWGYCNLYLSMLLGGNRIKLKHQPKKYNLTILYRATSL